jgi:hypothetical protein
VEDDYYIRWHPWDREDEGSDWRRKVMGTERRVAAGGEEEDWRRNADVWWSKWHIKNNPGPDSNRPDASNLKSMVQKGCDGLRQKTSRQ